MDSLARDVIDRRVQPGAFRRTEAAVAQSLRAAANTSLTILRRCLWWSARPLKPDRVCIYRIGNVGDTACAVPAMHAIRRVYPDAHLTLVTSPGPGGLVGARELLAGAQWIDEMLVYPLERISTFTGRLALLRDLRARRFDVWIELPVVAARFRSLLRNLLVARAAGARWGFGWRLDSVFFGAQAQSEALAFPTEVERLLGLLARAGIAAGEINFAIPRSDDDRRAVDDLLNGAARAASHLVALAPGAKALPNRWPSERFVEVGRRLASRGVAVLVMGGDDDRPLCEEIASALGGGALSLAGRTSLAQSCELLSRCALLVCNDSGVQHLAAAVGTPCVSIFSRRDFRGKWRPYGAQHAVIDKWVECHTCFLSQCPVGNRCINLIEVDEVVAAAERVLASTGVSSLSAA
jgi:ADP-heptose:LPS heptosyltransferase